MKCAYCGKELQATETHSVWVNGEKKELQFCDDDCAQMFQMGAEG